MRFSMPTERSVLVSLPRATLIEAVGLWYLVRAAIFILIFVVQYRNFNQGGLFTSVVDLFAFQEFYWYANIAESGYVGEGMFQWNTAYFPGTALLMRLGAVFGASPAIAGFIMAFISGMLAAPAMAVLAGRFQAVPKWAVLALALAPVSIFLSAPWSEGPFLALSLCAWVAAVRCRWRWAGMFAAGATLIRVNGLFLMIALVVLLLTTQRHRWREGWPLLLPAGVVAVHFTYLRSITGSWTAWRDAMSENFGRSFVDPITSFSNSYNLIFTYIPGTISSRFVIEIATALAMVSFTIILVLWRYWAEATYVGLTAFSLMTADLYQALPRSLLVLFPVWLVIARWMTVRRSIRIAYIAVAIPALAFTSYAFSNQQWIS